MYDRGEVIQMNYLKGIGYAVATWVVVFVVISILIKFNWFDIQFVRYLTAFIAPVAVYFFAANLSIKSSTEALGYGVIIVIVGLILDYTISRQYNAEIFASRTLWAGYVLTLFTPMLKVKR